MPRPALSNIRLYLVTGQAPNAATVLERCGAALRGGVTAIQLRQKDWSGGAILDCARQLLPLCRSHGALLVINDHLDVALAVGADGVHLGQEDLPLPEARRLAGSALLVGCSTHSLEQARRAQAEGAAYIGVGPLFSTPTKPGRPAIGPGLAAEMVAAVSIPTFVIGGIEARNLDLTMACRATGVAVVRHIWEASAPETAARALLEVLPPADPARVTLMEDLGERAFLDLVLPRLSGTSAAEPLLVGPGDDAAVWESQAGRVVATVDAFVEGVHFDLALQSAESAGWRAMALALSDVLAMGGEPTQALVTLSAPASAPVACVESIQAGLSACADHHGLQIVGGDTVCAAGPLSLGITVLGRCHEVLRRDGARPGQLLCVTGSLGAPAAGLKVLRVPELAGASEFASDWIQAFARPLPHRGRALVEAGVRVAGDISDGLLVEAERLAFLAGVRVCLDPEQIPLAPGLEAVFGRSPAISMALGGGEEAVMFFTLEADRLPGVSAALAAVGMEAIPVGEIEHGSGVTLEGTRDHDLGRGYEHFRHSSN